MAGYNYRITDIQCALGLSQLKKLDKFIQARRKIVKWYYQELKNCSDIILPEEVKLGFKTQLNVSGWHLYVVRVKNPKLRDQLMAYLKQAGIGVNFHYPAVYSHPYYRQHGYQQVKLPNEEIYQNSCISIPIYPDLTRAQVKFISQTIKIFFSSHGYNSVKSR